MPEGKYIIRAVNRETLTDYLKNLIESLGYYIRKVDERGDETIIKAVSRGRISALLWRIIPYVGRWTEKGQRVGIEVHLKDTVEGVLFGIAVIPHMEIFDRAEIYPLTGDLIEQFVDTDYAKKVYSEIIKNVKVNYPLESS